MGQWRGTGKVSPLVSPSVARPDATLVLGVDLPQPVAAECAVWSPVL